MHNANRSQTSYTLSDWSSEFEESMTSVGDLENGETPNLHLSISSELDREDIQSSKLRRATSDDSLSQIRPPSNHPTSKRRCSHTADPVSSWSDLTTSLHPDCFGAGNRRGSITSWGALNLSASTGASLNPYGYAANRRGSMASHSHHTRERSMSPGPGGRIRRRYSMTPSFEALSESEDCEDSDANFILYNTSTPD